MEGITKVEIGWDLIIVQYGQRSATNLKGQESNRQHLTANPTEKTIFLLPYDVLYITVTKSNAAMNNPGNKGICNTF